MNPPAELRAFGAAIGAATAPAVAWAQGWGKTGDARPGVWLLAIVALAALGAWALPLFFPRVSGVADSESESHSHSPELATSHALGPGFGALWGFSLALIGGSFVAFPLGPALGAPTGLLTGAATTWLAQRPLLRRHLPASVLLALSALASAGLGLGALHLLL